jgi:hypothetical protein
MLCVRFEAAFLLPEPYDNEKFPEVKTHGLKETWRAIIEDKERFSRLGL